MRICAACDSTTTYINNGYPQWHNHDGSWLCQKCYSKYVYNSLAHIKHRSRRMRFKGKLIYLKVNPRKEICSKCGKKGLTNIHHFAEYHDDDPLKDTIELCPSCHWKEHKRLESTASLQSG